MIKELSSLDLYYLLKELGFLVGAKLDKVYMPAYNEVLFQFHAGGVGKQLLRLVVGKYIFLTHTKFKNPQNPFGFCMFMRKYIENARVTCIIQKEFERIIEIGFEKKETQSEDKNKNQENKNQDKNNSLKYKLILELFSKGNIILLDENDIIISPLEKQIWKERTIKKGEKYIYPKKEYNFLTIDSIQLKNIISSSLENEIVKVFATSLGLGGQYAEELCARAAVNKKTRPAEINIQNINSLIEAIDSLRNSATEPKIIYQNSGPFAVVPFDMKIYEGWEAKNIESLNIAFDRTVTDELITVSDNAKRKIQNKDIVKLQKIVEMQSIQVENMQKAVEENQQKGELFYLNYVLIKGIIDLINELRKTKSWQEIKEMYKESTTVKSIDEKTGTIILDI